VFEDAEVDTDEPVLHRLANWCEQHTQSPAKPPVKAGLVRDRTEVHPPRWRVAANER
jgi:hypothetical protein